MLLMIMKLQNLFQTVKLSIIFRKRKIFMMKIHLEIRKREENGIKRPHLEPISLELGLLEGFNNKN